MKIEDRLRILEASDERQYMMNERYEVYEKQGAPLGAMTFHDHSFYEIIYCLAGEYSAVIDNCTYNMKKGDFLLIDRNVMHKYHYVEKKHETSKRIILWITPKQLAALSGEVLDLSQCFMKTASCLYHFPIYYEEMLQGYLLKLAMKEMAESKEAGAKEILDRGYLSLFFVYLNILCEKREYCYDGEKLVTHPMVEQVSAYIDSHLCDKIMVEELAEEVHMSKYHFLRKFKDITGVTAHEFIVNKRLIKACEFLRSGMSVTESSQRAGFAEYTSFLRNFREAYGISPGKYTEYYRGD